LFIKATSFKEKATKYQNFVIIKDVIFFLIHSLPEEELEAYVDAML
jgi:hypothetical protein